MIIKEDQIRLNYSKLSKEESSNKKNISNLKFPELGIALFLWFNQGRELGAPVSGDMIYCKVSELYPKIQHELLKNWLQGNKQRF